MKKTWVLAAVLVLLGLLVGAIAIGCGEAKKEEEAVANLTAQALLKSVTRSNIFTSGTNSGSISGKITDMLTGNPLIGASVSAGGKSATTNSSGNYTLSGVTPGTVTFSTNASGYEDISIVCNSSTINIGLLAENRSPMGTISGKVTDSSGNPVSGARVQAVSETYFDEPPVTETYTDSNGNYTLTNEAGAVVVCANSYTIEAAATRIIASQYKRLNLGTAATLNLQYPANTGTISGTVNNISTDLNNTRFGAMLIAGGSGVFIGEVPTTGGQYSCAVPPTQGSDKYLAVGYGSKTTASHFYHAYDYVSVSAGQTVTRNFTVKEPIQQVGPTDEAVVSTTPTFTWKPATGTTFDFYFVYLYSSATSKIVRTISTQNLSYTVPASVSMNPGNYYWIVNGIKVSNPANLSNFNQLLLTIVASSQHGVRDFTVQ
jgi:hypothetical protein